MVNTRGYTFIALNAVRVLSVISLLLLIGSSIYTMVYDVRAVNAFLAAGKSGDSGNSTAIDCSVYDCDYIEGSTVPNQPAGAFWAVLNWLLVIFQSIVCIFSEVGWPAKFFATFFPILGPDFGLGALGVIQGLLGAAVLSHHVNEFALVSAFFVFALGCVNVLLGLIFRERAKTKRSIAEWRDQDKDVLPTVAPGAVPVYNSLTGASYGDEKVPQAFRSDSVGSSKSTLGFGRQATKAVEARGYVVQEPEEAVPPYASKPVSRISHPSTNSLYSEPEPIAEPSSSGHDHDEQELDHVGTHDTTSSATAV